MKKTIPDQLRTYIEQVKHPDEQILAIEKQHIGWFCRIASVVLVIGIFAFLLWLSILMSSFSVGYFLIYSSMSVALVVALLLYLPELLLTTTYLAVTDKAIYDCTDFLSTNVYVWVYSEIVMVKCMRKEICIISGHGREERLELPRVKTVVPAWKNLFLALFGKPLVHRWFSLTQLYELSPRRKGRTYLGEEYPYCMKLRFFIGKNSALPDAFRAAAEKNPQVRIDYGNQPIE